MDAEKLREFCLSLPNATEDVKWGADLTFCIGEKMFAVTSLESQNFSVSFKCTPEKFAELIEKDGIIPAPYVARYHWTLVQKADALPTGELNDLIRNSYRMVFEKLPKAVQKKLSA